MKRFSNLENHSTFSHKILQWDHHHKAQHHPNRRKVIQSDRNASLGYTPKWAVVKRFANINPIFYLFIKAVPSQQGHMMQQMPMNAPPHHLQQNGPSHLSSAPNHLQHHPPMAPHGTIFFLLSLMAFQMNCLQIVLVSFMKNIFHFFSVPSHPSMQMQPMPPMNYPGHQMPPNVSYAQNVANSINKTEKIGLQLCLFMIGCLRIMKINYIMYVVMVIIINAPMRMCQ